MLPIRQLVRDLFGFSGSEINGFLILLPLMVILIVSEPLYRSIAARTSRQNVADVALLDSLLSAWPRQGTRVQPDPEVILYDFDPNTVAVAELEAWGVPSRLANRIAAYRQNGGVFRVKSDLMRIYGFDSALYKRLYPCIQLPGRRPAPVPATHRQDSGKSFDINSADTILLKTVNGIGSRLAARIVRFRDVLGGFVRPEQLYEVYGLDSVVVGRLLRTGFIKPDFRPVQLNINTASEETLSAHPYIRKKLARVLINYRFQHGDFRDVNDIKKLGMIRPEEADRILPYIKTGDSD